MINAVFSNPNYDQKEVNKEDIIQDIENNYQEAVDIVYGGGPQEAEIDEDDPFFAAMNRGLPDKDLGRKKQEEEKEKPEKQEYEVDQD